MIHLHEQMNSLFPKELGASSSTFINGVPGCYGWWLQASCQQ